jgi:predicted nucleic acid-binding protein
VILVDTSVWVRHLRAVDKTLVHILELGLVLAHPFVTGELALGNLRQRDLILRSLQDLPQAPIATSEEILRFISRYHLHGRGIGYVDAHLLASVSLSAGASLWTYDKRLQAAAATLEFEWQLKDNR